MKSLTLEQAKQLKRGNVLYHLTNKNADGSPQRWKVNGKVKLWKRDASRVSVPIKNGMRNCDYVTEKELNLVSLIPYSEKQFRLISEAKKYQRQKRKEGYKTQLDIHSGIAFPFCNVKWMEK